MAKLESCKSCTRPSESQYFNCPPRMDDGRHFTDYRPRCVGNDVIETAGRPMNSYEYRQYLIHNAEAIMSKSREVTYTRNACGPCVEPFEVGTMLPEQSVVQCDTSICSVKQGDPQGLGQGRNYYDNPDPSTQEFIKRRKADNEKLASAKSECCASAWEDAQYYPLDGVIPSDPGRAAVPGGGAPFSANTRTMF